MKENDAEGMKKQILERMLSLFKLKGARLTKREYIAAGVPERQVRKYFGGWNMAFDLSVNPEDTLKNQGVIVADRYKSLARSLHRNQTVEQEFVDSLYNKLGKQVRQLKSTPFTLDKKAIKEYLIAIKSKSTHARELTAIVSDWHLGLIVDSDEVGGSNVYTWKEACRRAAFFAQEIACYKLPHRIRTKKLNLVVLGDLCQGKIHNVGGTDSDLTVYQMNGSLHILYHIISYLLNYFGEIEFYGIPGNHEDWPFRRESGKRVKAQKYDSMINPIYFALSLLFKGKVKFTIPKTQYAMIDTIGGRLMGVHGDTVFSAIGIPSKMINTKQLTHQIETFNTGEMKKGNPAIAGVLAGHVHSEMAIKTQNGIDVIANSSLSGLDMFASSLSFNYSMTAQTVLESTKDYAIGDMRRVRFDKDTDKNAELDKIVPIYNKTLKYE